VDDRPGDVERPEHAPRRRAKPRRARVPASEWAAWDDDKLLDLRLCDLDLRIEGSGLEDRIAELHRDLLAQGLQFRPHFWLSDEWFCPDGVPGIAIPFYLAHPRLARLEQSQMHEVEGGTRDWCLKILRHEAGHALENAYLLRRRGRRRELFGRSSEPYPDHYAPKPYSRSFVAHLDSWYAQSHPDEDFAETFAVWLTAGSQWEERYAEWPALRKLEYVEELMEEIADRPPLVTTRRTPLALPSLRRTLRVHYRRKRRHYRVDQKGFYDRDLLQIFTDGSDPHSASPPSPSAASPRMPAARFLTRIRGDVRRRVRRWTGQPQYLIDQVLGGMVDRCRALSLRLAGGEEEARLEFTALVTARTMSHLQLGRHRVPL